MAERTVLLDATQAVIEAHTDLIANGTVAVASAADFKKYPPAVVGKLVDDHGRFCEVCGTLEYARTIPPKNTSSYPVDDVPAAQDAPRRIGANSLNSLSQPLRGPSAVFPRRVGLPDH